MDKPIGKWLKNKYILLRLPDHIESCHEEIERQITNSLEDIEENNEILRRFKLLSRRVKLKSLFSNSNWHELCCQKFSTQFCERLNNNKTSLQYLLYKQPQLLCNKHSWILMRELIHHLQYDTLREILTNIRDKKGQTYMFYLFHTSTCAELYRDHIGDLYKLLSIQNSNGQTALYVNAMWITDLLVSLYTPTQRDSFIKLTSIRDNHNKTALQVGDHFKLRSLIRRVENNEYVTDMPLHTPILIIYNTNKRSGAEEEAETIHNACQSKYLKVHITLEKNKTEEEIIDRIKQKANKPFRNSPLIVILMSHGSVGTIDDCDGKPIKLSDIEEVMCSHVLNGRPKMLITQCCQIETEVDEEQKPYVPTHEDFCAVMSAVAGVPSTRGIFLEKLAKQIKNSKKDTNIFKIVQDIGKAMKEEGHKQTPIIMSTLKAGFFPIDDWTHPK